MKEKKTAVVTRSIQDSISPGKFDIYPFRFRFSLFVIPLLVIDLLVIDLHDLPDITRMVWRKA